MGRFKGVCNCINEYLRISTAHGLRRSGWAVKFWGKIFWLFTFVVGMVAFVVLCGLLLADFAKYPVKMATSSQSNDVLVFPAVTVCNMDGSTQAVDDLIVFCTFNGMMCTADSVFNAYQSSTYGSCFTFNSKDSATKYQSITAGPNYGLTLMLNVDRSESQSTQPSTEGFRIAVHPVGSRPFPEINGFSLPSRYEGDITISYNYIKKLGSPYSKCTQMTLDSSGYNATSFTCEAPCMTPGSTQNCKCNPLCTETIIDTQFTLSQWPSLNHETTIVNMLKTSTTWQGNQPDGGINLTQMAFMTIYFDDFTTTNTSETKSFSLPQLISEIGGLSALCIGFSVLTVFEFVELVLSMFAAPMSGSQADTDRQSLASNSDRFDRSESRVSTETAGNPPMLPRMSSSPSFAIQDFAH